MKKIYYQTILVVSLLISIFSFMTFLDVYAKKNKFPLKNVIITLDPGHGGRDSGTRYGKLLEKDLNLEVSMVIKEQLEEYGATVYLVRDKDIDFSKKTDYLKKRGDLKRRINFIESKKSDLYLSIHMNWYSDYYFGGAEVLYSSINKKNYVLAQDLTDAFLDSGIKTREIKKTDLFLYNHTNTVGVLLECGFLSNSDDRYLLQTTDYQKKFSLAVANGIVRYINH